MPPCCRLNFTGIIIRSLVLKTAKLIRSAGVVGSFTLLSRGLGMLRDVIFGYFFGTSLFASAFLVAFKIPNLFRRLFGEGALSAAFIPILIETRKKEGEKAAWEMAAKVVTMTAALLTAITVIGLLIFSIGLSLPALPENWALNFELSRIMFPYVLLICLASLSMAVLNSYKHFSTSAFAPSLLNLILIGAMLFIFPALGENDGPKAYTLCFAVLAAGVAQIGIQLPALKRFGCPFKCSSRWNDPKIRRILALMGPATLGAGITQINVLIDGYLAVWIGDWAPAALFYSERLIYFPLGIIATAMSTVLLPTFSDHAADGNTAATRETITDSLRHLIFVMTPAALGLLVLAPDIFQALMEWGGGRFNAESTKLCARALMFYAPGLVAFSAAKVFIPAFYAMQDTKTPVRVGIGSVVLNLVLNLTFILTLPTYWKHAGMALSTVLASLAGMTTLGTILTRRIGGLQWRSVWNAFISALIASLIMAAVAWASARFITPLYADLLPAKLTQIASVVLAIALGALTYLLLSVARRAPELREIKSALRGR